MIFLMELHFCWKSQTFNTLFLPCLYMLPRLFVSTFFLVRFVIIIPIKKIKRKKEKRRPKDTFVQVFCCREKKPLPIYMKKEEKVQEKDKRPFYKVSYWTTHLFRTLSASDGNSSVSSAVKKNESCRIWRRRREQRMARSEVLEKKEAGKEKRHGKEFLSVYIWSVQGYLCFKRVKEKKKVS